MRTKKKSPRKVKRKTKRPANTTIANEKNDDKSLQCLEWVLSQKNVRPQKLQPQELTENTEEVVADSASSLASLKYKRSQFKKSVSFVCEWKQCMKSFDKEDDLCAHVAEHTTEPIQHEGKYCCEWDLCYFDTIDSDEIARHIHYHAYHTIVKTFGESVWQEGNIPRCTNDSRQRNTVPDLKNDFVCKWDNCMRVFRSVNEFYKHVKAHGTFEYDMQELERSKKIQMFPCQWDDCTSKFTVFYRLTEHIRKHTNEKSVGCFHCGGIFRSNSVFFNHCKRQQQNNTHEYQCAECFKYFATERLLRMHVVWHVNRLKCTMCNMTCNNMYSLSKHIRFRHISERPFKCTYCDQGYVCKSDLNKHIERMHMNKVYNCAEIGCEFSCKAIHILKRHDAEVHGNSPALYACHCCDKMYKSGRTLSKHLIKVHGFQLPSGHSRFWYRIDENGFYRLQTVRIESLEVTKQILSPNESRPFEEDIMQMVEDQDNDMGSENLSEEDIAEGIMVTINDVDKDGNIIGTKSVKASAITIT